MTRSHTLRIAQILAAAAIAAGAAGCVDNSAFMPVAPTNAPGVVEVITPASGTVAVSAVPSCLGQRFFAPDLSLAVTARQSNVFLDQVTIHLLDGTNVGASLVSFSRSGLEATFGNTLIRSGATRTFGLRPSFDCFFRQNRLLQADIFIVDPNGIRRSMIATATLP